uniref:Uncharacterized protein n=1 Tax=Anguilla anguilla TaxID=7936 RepID=A0A0E9XWJ7_ANGAN
MNQKLYLNKSKYIRVSVYIFPQFRRVHFRRAPNLDLCYSKLSSSCLILIGLRISSLMNTQELLKGFLVQEYPVPRIPR